MTTRESGRLQLSGQLSLGMPKSTPGGLGSPKGLNFSSTPSTATPASTLPPSPINGKSALAGNSVGRTRSLTLGHHDASEEFPSSPDNKSSGVLWSSKKSAPRSNSRRSRSTGMEIRVSGVAGAERMAAPVTSVGVPQLGISVAVASDVPNHLGAVRAAVKVQKAVRQVAVSGVLPLPNAVTAQNSPASGHYVGEEFSGTLTVGEGDGGLEEPVPFKVRRQTGNPRGSSFVFEKDLNHVTVIGHGDDDAEGIAAELSVNGMSITVFVRQATVAEVKRRDAIKMLKDAEQGKEYGPLHAQITRAKARGVEMYHIERAQRQLKELMKEGGHVDIDKNDLKELMDWSQITRRPRSEDKETQENCSVAGCCCNEFEGEMGEVLTFKQNAVNKALEGLAPAAVPGDQWLFGLLVDAALSCPDGCVWSAGGKFIMSALNRNQAPVATLQLLNNNGQAVAAAALKRLVESTEKDYHCQVTAIQLNFHPNKDTFHGQHRDIFSGKQRAGINCTCSFRQCVGTVCYTLGSSRQVLMEVATDEMSAIKPCCDDCTGCSRRRWLDSGEVMYFNDAWNKNHFHGVPKADHECGPRISVALLCA